MERSFIYITASSPDEAKALARRLVELRLAACANVIDRVASVYWWDGKVREGEEAVVVAKTSGRLVPDLVAEVKRMHSYSCPCVVAMPIAAGNDDFLAWIDSETAARV